MSLDNFELDFSALAIAARCRAIAKKAGILDDTPSKFPAFAWPGGYTLIYVSLDGDVICADCMNDPSNAENNFGGDASSIVDVTTYDEGPPEYCANCNKEMESSYGDPDNPED